MKTESVSFLTSTKGRLRMRPVLIKTTGPICPIPAGAHRSTAIMGSTPTGKSPSGLYADYLYCGLAITLPHHSSLINSIRKHFVQRRIYEKLYDRGDTTPMVFGPLPSTS